MRYIKFSSDAIVTLTKELGNPTIYFHDTMEGSHLKVNMDDYSWSGSMAFEWLYVNQPPFTTIEELLKELV